MKVQNVNNNQYNVSSKARIDFVGETTNYLSKGFVENITNRAKTLGADKDLLIISISKRLSSKNINGVDIEHNIKTSESFPSMKHLRIDLEGTVLPKVSIKENAEKYLNRYMGYLERLFKEKVK